MYRIQSIVCAGTKQKNFRCFLVNSKGCYRNGDRGMSKAKIDICKVLFCIVLLYIILCNLGKLNQICVIDDEFGYWGVGAYFAGYDWTGLTPTSPYYGYGLGFLYMLSLIHI